MARGAIFGKLGAQRCAYTMEILNVKVGLFILLLFASLPDCGLNQLFVRWTQSTLNRRLLDREPAVRVSHPQILERITLQHLQHVRGVTSQVFKHLGIPSVFRRKVMAKLPCHVRDLLVSTCSNQINVTEKC